MRLRHNKKRNTAFLYETLIKELTKTIIHRDEKKRAKIVLIIKENFSPTTVLGQELILYKNLNETEGVDIYTAERLIQETRQAYLKIDKNQIFNRQTALINQINRTLTKSVFSNFVPNYKNLATIAQVFTGVLPVKEKVLLERKLISAITSKGIERNNTKNMPHMDGLVYKKIIERFNNKYDDDLLSEQKSLLNHYLMAFNDNGISLKVFLNEEIGRLNNALLQMLNSEDVSLDDEMGRKTNMVLKMLSEVKNRKIDAKVIHDILKVQSLISEVEK
jgi:hypothetical protein